jgi:uncharacterized protein
MASHSSPLTFKVSDIRDEGLRVDEALPAGLLAETLEGTGFRPSAPARVNAELSRVSGGVLLRGRFTLPVGADCKRCLREVALQLPVTFTLNLVPAKQVRGEHGAQGEGEDDGRGERGGSFQLDDADREVFDGEKIELDPILREQVLLALPMDALCKESCKGLCAQCGQDLNEQSCGCEQKRVDPRLEPLKNIQLKPRA